LADYFKRRYDSGLTEGLAEQAFDRCMQGNLPFDKWIEQLNSLVLRCGWGSMTDKALKKQIIKGCSHAECRKELVRLAPRTAMEAIDIHRRVMNDLKDLESVKEVRKPAMEAGKPAILAIQTSAARWPGEARGEASSGRRQVHILSSAKGLDSGRRATELGTKISQSEAAAANVRMMPEPAGTQVCR